MYFPDQSPYEYGAGRFRGVLNVGWLSLGRQYTRGTVTPEIVEKLTKLAIDRPANQMRGFHYCELCDREDIRVSIADRSRALGSAEIWVPAPHGAVAFAAPDLVVHYVAAHEYRPPDEFLDAVAAVRIDALDIQALLSKHTENA